MGYRLLHAVTAITMRSQIKSFVFLLILVTGSARATLLLNEPFSYPDGPLVSAPGTLWTTHSGTAGQVDVVSGHVNLTFAESEDVNALLAGQPYPANTNTVLYASFVVNFSALPGTSGEYFAHFKAGGTSNYRARVFALTSGAAAGKYRLGISSASDNASATNAIDLNTNSAYRVYVRYGVSNQVATLWVDPTAEGSPSVSAIDGTNATTVIAFALRQTSGIGIQAFDDLRVGTTFADVYQAPVVNPPTITQQPGNTAAVEGGIANFSVVATGTAPLSYQWTFYGTNLPGANGTSLTLNGVTTNQSGPYAVTVSNTAGSTNSATATLSVITASSGTYTLVTYNVKGNFASDWTTNAAQVQAIARELQYLNPDIITLNEIPNGLRHEMTNWMIAFFPTYTLAVSSNTDGVLRSGFISRYPITRSQSWLYNASLTNFGYNGTYTRDLFEAEILVPGATEPLHVFTTHLKSGPDADSQDRRAGECSAVSNFFATVFVPTYGSRPYVLTGDLNEDIAIPMSHNNQAIQRLISSPTGLKLTTPVNPFTGLRFTHSIQGVLEASLDARFDYIMPAGVLSSNIVASQVFRTDKLPPPLPLNLNSNDDIVASDHLPVMMVFNYPDPALRLTLARSNATSVVSWPALVGRRFRVDSSTDLTSWTTLASNLVATTSTYTFTTNVAGDTRFFRVYRTP